MLCPFCQQSVEFFDDPTPDGAADAAGEPAPGLRCLHCNNDNVPRLYVEYYNRHPAVPVCIFGPTGHGKTMYIDALLTHLEQSIQQRIRWPHFYCNWVDEAGRHGIRQRLRELKEFGILPQGTNKVFPYPQVIRLGNVPQIGGCQLIFYDTSGEAFLDVASLMDYGRYVRFAAAVIWLISLTDLQYPEQLSDLMTTYAEAMVRMGGNPKTQAVIVALTKGDLFLRNDHPLRRFPPRLENSWKMISWIRPAMPGYGLRHCPHRYKNG